MIDMTTREWKFIITNFEELKEEDDEEWGDDEKDEEEEVI
jgi:hypothetical protein